MELTYGVMEDDSWLKKRYYHGRNSTVVIL